MKVISVHVDEADYAALKEIAAREGRPVAELIRSSIAETVRTREATATSIFELPPFPGPKMKKLKPWKRHELYDEMLKR